MRYKYVLMPIAASFAACNVFTAYAKSKEEKHESDSMPNVVLILVDDVGWGAFAPNLSDFGENEMNQDFIQKYKPNYSCSEAMAAAFNAMPNIIEYCNQGIRFTNAYVTANVSGPSRAGLLTSSYQQRYGIYINQEAEAGIPERIKLMPQILKENGYINGIFGKYHNGKSIDNIGTCSPGHHPLDRGFDYFYGFNSHGTTYYNSPMIFRNWENVEEPEYLTDRFTEEAVNFIYRNKGCPKLVYVPYNALHGPLGAPAPEKYKKRFKFKSKTLNNYAAYMAAVDDGVAAIMNTIKEIGEYDNTILIFLSDNGAPGYPGVPLPKNGPFSGFKGQSMQGGYRIPMFIWYGDNIKGGLSCDQMVSSMDIFPTIMDIAGIKMPKNQKIDGKSLKPILSGNITTPIHNHLVWMSQQAENWGMGDVKDQNIAQAAFMVREGNYVLRYVMEDDIFYLYDLSTDRAEKINLASAKPEIADHLKSIFKEWFTSMEKPAKWKPELWQNVQFWDNTLPTVSKPNRAALKYNHIKKATK